MTQRPHNERNAGRKPYLKPEEKVKSRTVLLNDKQYQQFKALGGTRWLREKIEASFSETL